MMAPGGKRKNNQFGFRISDSGVRLLRFTFHGGEWFTSTAR